MPENRDILEEITAAQREASELMLHAHGILAEIKTGHRDVVTEFDKKVQELLIERLGHSAQGGVKSRAVTPGGKNTHSFFHG